VKTEEKLVEYVVRTRYSDIPPIPLQIAKNVMLTVIGTTIAGSTAEGCEDLVKFYREIGGKEEATILIYDGKVPAENAAFVNGVMGRALDFCDAMAPGLHMGSSIVPVALAASELTQGCTGKEFLTALVLGAVVGARVNLSEAAYDGFDPTGVAGVFAATATAARILRLSAKETWNALALAFNRSGGSFQSNIDGSLAVRTIQGWVSQNSLNCARLAQLGITGPKQFLEGVYGYLHLFGRDKITPDTIVRRLGESFEMESIVFKKYPSCGLTLASTDVILDLMREKHFETQDIERIEVHVPPYAHKLVGHRFQMGDSPRVNAQFSIQYCVANALLRKNSKLRHFEPASVAEPTIMQLIDLVHVTSDASLEARGHTAVDMRITTRDGKTHYKGIDVAPGFPGNSLTQEEHEERFWDCVDFAGEHLPRQNTQDLLTLIAQLEDVPDVRAMIPLLVVEG
jgi:2-methylcitrate dehydratase PrpD